MSNEGFTMVTQKKHDSSVLVEERVKTRKPKLYKVILHNDDFTTMDFVVYILKTIFHKSHEEAIHLMLSVHKSGHAVCGIYPKDMADTKTQEVIRLARLNEFPLLCTIEKE
jgi:ATP-dependent Clp protease adaptor protein ClpS